MGRNNNNDFLIEALARIVSGESVAFIGVSKERAEHILRFFNQTLGDTVKYEPVMSARAGLAPEFLYDEEGIVAMLPKPPAKLIGYSFKISK